MSCGARVENVFAGFDACPRSWGQRSLETDGRGVCSVRNAAEYSDAVFESAADGAWSAFWRPEWSSPHLPAEKAGRPGRKPVAQPEHSFVMLADKLRPCAGITVHAAAHGLGPVHFQRSHLPAPFAAPRSDVFLGPAGIECLAGRPAG